MICANCKTTITDEYLIIGDNYLQAKFFDSTEDNIFCCQDWLCETLSVLTIDIDETTENE